MIKYFYLRDSKKNPKACVAIKYDANNKKLSYGFSSCSKHDSFVKSTARELAATRINNVIDIECCKFSVQMRTVLQDLTKSNISTLKKLSKKWFKQKV